ncbi:uncharacterized protein LOC124532314 isoform X2 [Vanessa cardui]|uniref:uncharacterized protein LOC124532314 isoform X2 n=1 Tax=Vanessa cardui TaxID=171605 RepID=UPI001F134C8A|nr:uncharacterized protein LOC124532314 isoform X2 [Vanessa cardui]
MRTYTRKRTEYQLIEGVHEMCRLCLEKVKETVPIFTDTDNVCASLTMRIMMCVGLQITREDCLPDMICTECHKELNNFYEFKKRCILTYQKLKSHLLAVKQSGTKKDTDMKEKQEQNETQNLLDRLAGDNVVPALDVKETQHLEVNVDLNGLSSVPNEQVKKPSTELSTSNETHKNQDVSEFLSSILSELGILTRNGDQALMMDQNMKSIEIETGDDTKMILELLEIDEGQQNGIKNEVSNNQISIQSTIKYIEPLNIEKSVVQPKDKVLHSSDRWRARTASARVVRSAGSASPRAGRCAGTRACTLASDHTPAPSARARLRSGKCCAATSSCTERRSRSGARSAARASRSAARWRRTRVRTRRRTRARWRCTAARAAPRCSCTPPG